MDFLNMSPMQLKGCAAAALFVMLLVFELASRAHDRALVKSGQAEDLRKGDTALKKHNMVQRSKARVWSEGLLIIATGAAILLWVAAMVDYQDHGAFYDEAWRMPGVEDHFHFTTDDTERLQALYDADPEGFDFTAGDAIVVKLGCQDCEDVYDTLDALYATGGYSVIFSNSDVGRAYVEHFGITYVPSVVYAGNVVELRTGNAQYGDGEPVDGFDAGEASDRLKEWLESQPEGGGAGTKAGDGALWEKKNQEGNGAE